MYLMSIFTKPILTKVQRNGRFMLGQSETPCLRLAHSISTKHLTGKSLLMRYSSDSKEKERLLRMNDKG